MLSRTCSTKYNKYKGRTWILYSPHSTFCFSTALREIQATCHMLELVFLSELGVCLRCVLGTIVGDHDLWNAVSCRHALCVHYDLFIYWPVKSGNFNVSGVIIHNNQVGIFSPFKRSVPIFFQGSSGIGDGVSWHTVCLCALKHLKQFWTRSSSSLEIPGHQTLCLALSLHFVMPWCPLWILCSISWWIERES